MTIAQLRKYLVTHFALELPLSAVLGIMADMPQNAVVSDVGVKVRKEDDPQYNGKED